MDEILASIRRIIESGDEPSDTARAGEAPAAPVATTFALPPSDAPQSPLPQFDVHYSPNGDADYSEDELRELAAVDLDPEDDPREEAEETFDAESNGPVGAQDGAAEAFAPYDEAEDDPEPDADHDDGTATVPPPAGNENMALEEDEDEAAPAARAAPAGGFSFEFDDEAFEAALRSDAWQAPAAHAPTAAPAPLPATPVRQPPPVAPMPESVIDGASALLSAQAGDQVAAAFDDLTRAIRDGQMRSMEEMAREMLRPMLREWLDDNLPRLVERLVRDEIERISRGPRR